MSLQAATSFCPFFPPPRGGRWLGKRRGDARRGGCRDFGGSHRMDRGVLQLGGLPETPPRASLPRDARGEVAGRRGFGSPFYGVAAPLQSRPSRGRAKGGCTFFFLWGGVCEGGCASARCSRHGHARETRVGCAGVGWGRAACAQNTVPHQYVPIAPVCAHRLAPVCPHRTSMCPSHHTSTCPSHQYKPIAPVCPHHLAPVCAHRCPPHHRPVPTSHPYPPTPNPCPRGRVCASSPPPGGILGPGEAPSPPSTHPAFFFCPPQPPGLLSLQTPEDRRAMTLAGTQPLWGPTGTGGSLAPCPQP